MTVPNHNFKVRNISVELEKLGKEVKEVIAEHQPFDEAVVSINYLIADLDRQLQTLEDNNLLTEQKKYERQEDTLAQIRKITMKTIEHRNRSKY